LGKCDGPASTLPISTTPLVLAWLEDHILSLPCASKWIHPRKTPPHAERDETSPVSVTSLTSGGCGEKGRESDGSVEERRERSPSPETVRGWGKCAGGRGGYSGVSRPGTQVRVKTDGPGRDDGKSSATVGPWLPAFLEGFSLRRAGAKSLTNGPHGSAGPTA